MCSRECWEWLWIYLTLGLNLPTHLVEAIMKNITCDHVFGEKVQYIITRAGEIYIKPNGKTAQMITRPENNLYIILNSGPKQRERKNAKQRKRAMR